MMTITNDFEATEEIYDYVKGQLLERDKLREGYPETFEKWIKYLLKNSLAFKRDGKIYFPKD